ncbi:MAG: hypothetical protein FWC10_11050, partial [Lentimicrobiaceae bacterium]|nr:hypothetical protein [Lentimicrobiaceae bacterium]
KTLTSDLFSSNNLDYVSDVYKYIFKQLHDIDLEGKLKDKKESIIVPSKMNEEITMGTETKQQANETEYRERLKQATTKKSQVDLVISILKENNFAIDRSLELISNTKGFGKKSKIFQAIKECLKSKQETTTQTLGFEFPPEKEFYLDDNAWSYVENLAYKNQKIKDNVRKNLKKIQEEYRKNGFYDKRGDSKDNRDVIDHFLKWNISDMNKYNRIQPVDFSNKIRGEIRTILESKYPN